MGNTLLFKPVQECLCLRIGGRALDTWKEVDAYSTVSTKVTRHQSSPTHWLPTSVTHAHTHTEFKIFIEWVESTGEYLVLAEPRSPRTKYSLVRPNLKNYYIRRWGAGPGSSLDTIDLSMYLAPPTCSNTPKTWAHDAYSMVLSFGLHVDDPNRCNWEAAAECTKTGRTTTEVNPIWR